MTKRTSGDAKWVFERVVVQPGTTYTFSDWYRSNVGTQLTAEVRSTTGALSYLWIKDLPAASAWTKATGTVTAPAGAQSMTVFHLIAKVGWLDTDEYSITGPTPPPTSTTTTAAPSTTRPPVTTTTAAPTTTKPPVTTTTVPPTTTKPPATTTTAPPTTTTVPPTTTTTTTVPPTTTKPPATTTTTTTTVPPTTTTTTVPPTTTTTVPPTTTTVPTTPPAGELLPNGGVETAGTPNTVPAGWTGDSWGTLAATFTYPTGDAHGGSRYLRVAVTSYSSGDAKWSAAPQPVTPGQTYRYTDWYRSNVSSQVLAVFAAPGSTVYQWLSDPVASPTWTKYSSTFVAPAGATSITIYHLVQSVGWLETDDHSIVVETAHPFDRPLVTLTFDDGWASHATQALPALAAQGMKGTFYIVTDFINTDGYLTTAQLLALRDGGQDLGSHTLTHPHLPTLTSARMDAELQNSKTALSSMVALPIDNLATPYGEYDATVLGKIKLTYGSHRTVNSGYNTRVDTDVHQLKVQNILNTTTPAEVAAWVATAKQQGTWLILVFHDIAPTGGDTWDSTPAQLAADLQAVKNSGVTVATLTEALAEIRPQLQLG